MHLQILKIIFEQNENPVAIEKNLVQKNLVQNKTRSYTVQFGSTDRIYLTITKPNNSEWSEAQQQKFYDQLDRMEQDKKLFNQIVDSKSGISKNTLNTIRGGYKSKVGPGARAKSDARARAKTQRGVVDAFSTPPRDYSPYQKPLFGRKPAKIRNNPFDQDQNQKQGSCKSDVKGIKNYNIRSQIDKHGKLAKISKKIRKNPKLVKEFSSLEQKLGKGNMKAGRGVKFLPGSNNIYYARGYTEGARIYFQYSGNDIIILAESNKPTQDAVIEFLLDNF